MAGGDYHEQIQDRGGSTAKHANRIKSSKPADMQTLGMHAKNRERRFRQAEEDIFDKDSMLHSKAPVHSEKGK